MKAWWVALPLRQQRLVMALAVVVVGVLFFVGIWEPLTQAREARRAEVVYHQNTLNSLVEAQSDIEALRNNQSRMQTDPNQSLLRLADESARAAGLAGSLTRIEPVNENQVNVWLGGARFDEVMAWLSALSVSTGIQVEQMSATRQVDGAEVDVRVSLMLER